MLLSSPCDVVCIYVYCRDICWHISGHGRHHTVRCWQDMMAHRSNQCSSVTNANERVGRVGTGRYLVPV